MERLGALGVHTLEELQTFSSRVSTAAAPQAPPRRGAAPRPRRLPVPRRRSSGSSTSAPRATCAPGCAPTSPPPRPAPGWARWSTWPTSVTGIVCATPLEAEVRELRLIAEHKPRYNRRSRFPEKIHFVKLTREPWPRLSLVRRVLDDDADYLGPFSSRQGRRAVPGRAPRDLPGPAVLRPAPPRALPVGLRAGRDGPLPVPLRRQRRGRGATPRWSSRLRHSLLDDPDDVVEVVGGRMAGLAGDERFEEAGVHRDRLGAFVRAAAAHPAARRRSPAAPRSWRPGRDDGGRWAVHVVRHGRLAAAGVIPPGRRRPPLRRRAARRRRDGAPPARVRCRRRRAEESERILRWLESPGVRLVDVDGEWTCPVAGAGRHLAVHDAVQRSRARAGPLRRAARARHGAPAGASPGR